MQRTKKPTELKIVFEKKALINTNFGNACEFVKTLSFKGNASGREPLYKNGKPYTLCPMTKKTKYILFNFVNHRLHSGKFICFSNT